MEEEEETVWTLSAAPAGFHWPAGTRMHIRFARPLAQPPPLPLPGATGAANAVVASPLSSPFRAAPPSPPPSLPPVQGDAAAEGNSSDDDTHDGTLPAAPPATHKQARDEEVGAEEAPAVAPPKRQRTINEVLACPRLPPSTLAELRAAFTPHCNALNAHPLDRRVRTVFTDTRHDTFLDDALIGYAQGWYSPSDFIKILWKPFDREGIAKQGARGAVKRAKIEAIAAATTSGDAERKALVKQLGKSTLEHLMRDATPAERAAQAAEVEAEAARRKQSWEHARTSGSRKHAAEDRWLQTLTGAGEPTAEGEEPPPLGFFRAMAELAVRFDVFRTEFTMYDEAHKAKGQADLLLRERSTGKIFIADHKHCATSDILDETKAFKARDYGWHWASDDWLNSKKGHYLFQLSFYRRIARDVYGWDVGDEVILLCYPPDAPGTYQLAAIPALDLGDFWALLPWRFDDPRHYKPWPLRGNQRLLAAPAPADDDPVWTTLREDDRVRTRRVRAPFSRQPLTDAMEWVERAYTPAGGGAPRAESALAHPWRWFRTWDAEAAKFYTEGAPPPFTAGFYERHLLTDRDRLREIPRLAGKQLVCWCTDPDSAAARACHAHVLLKYCQLYEAGLWQPPPDLMALAVEKQ